MMPNIMARPKGNNHVDNEEEVNIVIENGENSNEENIVEGGEAQNEVVV
jgi:hypothetical protein